MSESGTVALVEEALKAARIAELARQLAYNAAVSIVESNALIEGNWWNCEAMLNDEVMADVATDALDYLELIGCLECEADHDECVNILDLPEPERGPAMTIPELMQEHADYQRIFEMQQSRMGEATAVWRVAHPGNELVLPDLGDLLHWLVLERARLAAEREQAVAVLREMAEWHAGVHTTDCPEDDTCDCQWKPFNDRVNAACRLGEDEVPQ